MAAPSTAPLQFEQGNKFEMNNFNALAEKWLSSHRGTKEPKLTKSQLNAESVMRHLLDYVFYQKDFDENAFTYDLEDGDGRDPVEQRFRTILSSEDPLWGPRDPATQVVENLEWGEIHDPKSKISKIIAVLETNISPENLTKISSKNFLSI